MENKYYNENYYNANTILKFLRKVLNEINKSYVDSGMRTAFLMKRYLEKYKLDTELSHQHVLLCMLKDIGLFYMDGAVPSNDPALAAASSYAFLHQCSPLGEAARPLLFYKAKYMEDVSNPDYEMGLLMTLLDHVSLYIYERKDVDEIEEILREDRRKKKYHPDQVKKVIKLLKDHPDIIEKLNSESELYVYETSKYISLADYGTDTLGEFLDTTSFMFEFHNHETMAHTVTTAQIAYDLAISCKLTESTSRAIEIAGKVHDIGKIRVPLEILCYPGKLEGEALLVMQSHAKYTKEIIEGCFSYVIVEIAARHHEKLDGSGYPLGITKKDLTSADKVLAVADICSALYCKRSYKAAFTPEKIQSILLSDAKAGKLDERIVNHLIDDYDNIMKNAKAVEDVALKKYDTMKDEYEALAKSPALRHVFGESEDVDEERPESLAADETEEYISEVINYESKKDDEEVVEEIIYVDENGNEIDYNPEEEPSFEPSYEEEKEIDPLEEYNQAEMGDVPIEKIEHEEEDEETEEKEEIPLPIFNLDEKIEEEPIKAPVEEEKNDIDDEFDAFLNSIPEKAPEEPKKFVPKVPLKNPVMDFDPFKEDIDPVFQEPILPKKETKEDIDDEFDAFLNSIPEIDEKDDPFKESTDSEEKLEDVEETPVEEEKEEVVEAKVEEEKEEIDTVEEALDTPKDEDVQEPVFEPEEELNEEHAEEKEDIEAQESLDKEDSTEDMEVQEEENLETPMEEEALEDEATEEFIEEAIEESNQDIEDSKEKEPIDVDNSIDSKYDSDEEVDDSKEEIDASTEESDYSDEEIDSKYDDSEEEVDNFIEDAESKEEPSFLDPFNSSNDDGKKSFFDDEEVDDSIEDVEEESIDSLDLDIEDDSINNEEENLAIDSKYEDNDEEVDGSTSNLEEEAVETEEASTMEKEEEYVDSYFSEEELKEDEEALDSPSNEEAESKEEEYVDSYFSEEELKEDEESEDLESNEEPEENKEEEYVDSYFSDEELNEDEESKEEDNFLEASKEEEYVDSYFTEEELNEDEEESKDLESNEDEEVKDSSSKEAPESVEDIKPIEEPKEESDEELDMDLDDDEDDEEDDDDEEEEDDEDEDEEEDSNPKHKKFFSNDIYRKMFTYNPNKKKK